MHSKNLMPRKFCGLLCETKVDDYVNNYLRKINGIENVRVIP